MTIETFNPHESYWRKMTGRGVVGLALVATGVAAISGSAEAYVDNGDGTVTVEQGDTLWQIISDHTGASGQQLIESIDATAKQNNLQNKNEIMPGQRLQIIRPQEIHQSLNNPENTGKSRDAVWIVGHVKHTPWLISHITAAIEGTSQPEALAKIIAANPDMVPEKLQIGDSFRLPGTSQNELDRALKFISHAARIQQTPSGSGNVPQNSNIVGNPQTSTEQPDSPNQDEPKKEKPMNTDPKILANQVLEHPNITVEESPNNRVERSIEDARDDGHTFNYDVENDNKNEIPLSPRLLQALKFLADKGYKIEITSVTTGYDHVEDSNHYRGLAVDIAINDQTGYVFTDLYINREILGLNELILGTPPAGTTNLKHGQTYGYNEHTLRNHDNHIHFSVLDHTPIVDQAQGDFLEIEPDGEVHPANQEPTESSNSPEDAEPSYDLSSEEIAIIDRLDLEPHKKDFLKQTIVAARKTAQNYKVNPAVMVAQAILESSWGENAAGYNFFGMKADSNWQGATQQWNTFEYDENGNRYETTAAFKAFSSPEEAFNEYGRMIQDATWYDDAEANHTSWQGYLHGLINEPPMYATAPDYEQVVSGIVEQYQLAQLTHTN